MRPSRFPVLWFFVIAYVLSGVGKCVFDVFVSPPRLPGMAWLPYYQYFTGTGPSLAGLLMIMCLYGLAGIRRLAFQLSPWSVGGAWLVLVLAVYLLELYVVFPVLVLASLVGLLIVLCLHGRGGIRRLAFVLRPWILGQGWPVLAFCLLLHPGVAFLNFQVRAMFGEAVPLPSFRYSRKRMAYNQAMDASGKWSSGMGRQPPPRYRSRSARAFMGRLILD